MTRPILTLVALCITSSFFPTLISSFSICTPTITRSMLPGRGCARPSAMKLQMLTPPPPPNRDGPQVDRRPPPPPPLKSRSHLDKPKEMDDWEIGFQEAEKQKQRRSRELTGMYSTDKKGNLKKMRFVIDHENDDIEEDLQNAEWQTAPEKDQTWDEWRKRASDWMFYDQARIYVAGGDGGDGICATRREKYIDNGGPWGGNGGNGGHVIFEATGGDNTLARVRSKQHVSGTHGQRGQGKGCHGFSGNDLVIKVPVGTIVREEISEELIADMSHEGQRVIVARGGQGGRGNMALKTPNNPMPEFAELGEKGHARWLTLQLKLVADVGIVGVPNAGKSTLISAVTNARPKIADYPFTTVVPNLGVCQLPGADCETLVLADIPGLLEGAHEGVGLGHAFLRHVERCRVLIHLVDGSAEDPIYNLKAIQNELELFNPDLCDKPQVVLVNKMDIPEVRQKWPQLREEIKKIVGHGRVDAVSAVANANVMETMVKVKKLVASMPEEDPTTKEMTMDERLRRERKTGIVEQSKVVKRGDGTYEVLSDARLKKAILMTNWDFDEAVERFYRILKATGVRGLLEEAGAEEGDTIILEGFEFEYQADKDLMAYQAKQAGYLD